MDDARSNKAESLTPAIVVILIILLPLTVYVTGYLCLGELVTRPDGSLNRTFPTRMVYDVYKPALRMEGLLRGNVVIASYYE